MYLLKEMLPDYITGHLYQDRLITELQFYEINNLPLDYSKNECILKYSTKTKSATRCLLKALCEEQQGYLIKEIVTRGKKPQFNYINV